jgi:hypothetical protein
MTHPPDIFSSFTNAIEVPDIQEIERMEQLQQKAIEALEICGNGDKVRCQKCGSLQPMFKEPPKPTADRIGILEQRIKRVELLHSKKNIPNNDYDKAIHELKS